MAPMRDWGAQALRLYLVTDSALARGRVLVTSNEREFARVEGLAVENWRAG